MRGQSFRALTQIKARHGWRSWEPHCSKLDSPQIRMYAYGRHFVDVVCSIAHLLLLEGIGTPRFFEIEQKLCARLHVPVLHANQHATAMVTLTALLNATIQTGSKLRGLTVGVVGLADAGSGIARLLHAHGVTQLLGNDLRTGAMGRLARLHGRRESLEKIFATRMW